MTYTQQDWESDVWDWYVAVSKKYPDPSSLKLQLSFGDGAEGELDGWGAIEFLDPAPHTPEQREWFAEAIQIYRANPIKW